MYEKADEYRQFVDKTFQELDDLEAESRRHPLNDLLREYRLTMAQATRLYYKKGMTGRQLMEAIRTDREK
jgi:hypothetical protein